MSLVGLHMISLVGMSTLFGMSILVGMRSLAWMNTLVGMRSSIGVKTLGIGSSKSYGLCCHRALAGPWRLALEGRHRLHPPRAPDVDHSVLPSCSNCSPVVLAPSATLQA